MKTRNRTYKCGQSITALACVFCILFLQVAPTVSYAATAAPNDEILQSADVTNMSVEQMDNGQIRISGNLSSLSFSVAGKLYQVYDDINCNKVYFVETTPDYTAPVIILNLEFETGATLRNLNVENQSLVGQNVIRVAAYANDRFYYAEQACVIDDLISNNVISISRTSDPQTLQQIISNTSWYFYVEPKTLECTDSMDSITTYATPKLDDSLDSVDIDVINKIGRQLFTRVQFGYNWTDTGGYVIDCVEWPVGTGNILTQCLYYEIVRNTPSANDNNAVIEVELVADRQYSYVASDNTIEAHFPGTDFRMYDVKLALACTQSYYYAGYDYIYQQTTSLTKNDNTHPGFTIAKAMAMQFDKYGVLAVADSIFNAFSSNDAVSGTSTFSWPNDFTAHYNSISHGKRAQTMVRAIRIDTAGHLLNEEGAYLHLEAKVMDRDYADSTTSASLTKAIKYAFSYDLRSKNGVWLWVNGGDYKGTVTYEGSKLYTK